MTYTASTSPCRPSPWPWQGFFLEAKASSKRPTEAQLEWIDKRRQVGLEATWFNQFAAGDRPAEAAVIVSPEKRFTDERPCPAGR